jgi:hypothetical protein
MLILPVAITVLLSSAAAYEPPVALRIVIVVPAASYSQPERDFELLKEVGISPEKSERLGKLDLEFQSEIGGLVNQIKENQERLKMLILEENPDVGKIEKVLRDQESVRTQIILKGIVHELYIKKILTKEEWNKLMKLRIERAKRWRERSYEGM